MSKMYATICFRLGLCLLLTMALASAAQKDVISSKKLTIKGVRGNFMYHYSQGSACRSLVMLVVGTGMSVGDYDILATNIAQSSPDTVAFMVDNNPRNIVKSSAEKFADISNAIVDQLTSLVSICPSVPTNKIFLGGHSAGGQAAIGAVQQREQLLNYKVAGFIGMAPFDVSAVDEPPIDVPSLQWGFSKTSCGVTYTKAALLSYQISQPQTGRVFYQVQTDNWNTLLGGPHCSFTDSSCLGLCGGSRSMKDFVHEGVGESIKVLIEKAAYGIRKSDFELEITSPETVNLFVNQDEIVASRKAGVGATLAEK